MRLQWVVLIQIFAAVILFANNLTVGPTGCTYTNLETAITASVAGDSIELKNGPTLYVLSSSISIKKGVCLYSTSILQDTIEGPAGNHSSVVMSFAGDNITLKNLVFRHSRNSTGTVWMIWSTNFGGFLLDHCRFSRNGRAYNENRGLQLGRNSGSVVTKPSRITHCIFDSIGAQGASSHTWDGIITHLTIDSSILNASTVNLGNNCVLRHCTLIGALGENSMCGDSILIEYNLLNPNGGGGEFLSWDENTKPFSVGTVVRYNIFDSCGHVPIMIDGIQQAQIYGNVIISRADNVSYYYAIYNHSSGLGDSCENVAIFNNTLGGNPLVFTTAGQVSNRLSFKQNLGLNSGGSHGTGGTYANNITNDTIDQCVYTAKSPTLQGFDVTGANVTGQSENSLVIDSKRYPFLKRTSAALLTDSTYAGARKFLVNLIRGAYNVTDHGFSVDDSLSDMFWYWDPIAKDSGAITLQTATSKTGMWASASVSSLQKAGEVGTLAASGLTRNTRYFYRLAFVGTAQTGGLADTTAIDSVTTNSTQISNFLHGLVQFDFSASPMATGVDFAITLDKAAPVKIRVYNAKGSQLWEYFNANMGTGYHQVKWPNVLGNGVYIAILDVASKTALSKFTVMR